jgi:hypothetical protein
MMVLSSQFIFTKYTYFTYYIQEYKIGVDTSHPCACFKGIQRSVGTYSVIINKALNGGSGQPHAPGCHTPA